MTVTQSGAALPQLAHVGNVVPEGYEYREKRVTPGADLSLATAYLKWYDICLPEVEITPEQDAESRAFVTAEVSRLPLAGDLGFVLLHRAGPVLLLLISTWRNTNEVWESVYVKDAAQPAGYASLAFEGAHRGTFCVWELPVVWHERQAWVHFLSSNRDDAAKWAYITNRFAGLV
ncbi:MAG: hypothetical protein H7Y32_00600 [Chloroflexales bacterium]|nr:hypothetical protein [Chloroflexales bacterium]